MDMYGPYNTETFCGELDKAKDIVLQELVNDGFLKREDAEHFSKTRTFIIRSPFSISRFYKKIFQKTDYMSYLAKIRIED